MPLKYGSPNWRIADTRPCRDVNAGFMGLTRRRYDA